MSPRLLSLNTYHYRRGGSDAVFFDHDQLFRDIGWTTAMFAMLHPKNDPSPWSAYFADELEFGHEYSLGKKLLMATKVIYSREARTKIDRLVDKFQPDIAHAHCIYHHLSPSVLGLLHERGIPTVMTAHDLKLACPAYKMLNRGGICEKCKSGNLLNVIANRCIHNSLSTSTLVAIESGIHKSLKLYRNNLDRIVVPSRFYGSKLAEWGWPAKMLEYIPNFIDSTRYVPQYAPGNYFLYFGRLAPEKGVDTLIRAAIDANIELRIAGTGPYEQQLRSLVPESNSTIKFVGFQSGDALWSLIRESRAVVLPSEWYENAPISVLEAYASGKPVIAARIGGIAEMLEDGTTGYLFESGNQADLAAKLSAMEGLSEARIAEMGRQCREYVNSEFSPERYLGDMRRLYASLGVSDAEDIH